MNIVEFLRARLDEEEAVARAAIDPDRPGTHWHWQNVSDESRPAMPDEDTGGEYLEMDGHLWLCTIEEFPLTWGGPDNTLPAVVISTAEEVKTGGALHIARHDPARVLREVEAKRAIIGRHPEILSICQGDGEAFPCRTLAALASVYADHPDYADLVID